jgi:hypothetical protein
MIGIMAAETPERISISITGETSEFVTSYRNQYKDEHISSMEVVRRGLRLLKLVELLESHERLVVENTRDETSIPVVIPWKKTDNVISIPEL